MDYTGKRVNARANRRTRVTFEEETILPSIETTGSRPARKPRSQIAEAIASREQTPAAPPTDSDMTSGAEAPSTPRRRRPRAGTPRPPPTPATRSSKRKRNLDPSNEGLDTAPTPKRARNHTMPRSRRAVSPNIKTEETTPSPNPMHYVFSNAVIPSWITLACTAIRLPSSVDTLAHSFFARFEPRLEAYPVHTSKMLAVVGACIIVACGELGVNVLYDEVAQKVGCDQAEMAKVSGYVYTAVREGRMGDLITNS